MSASSVIDCCVHHAWSSPAELVEYMPDGWREYVASNVPSEWREYLHGARERPAAPMRYSAMAPGNVYRRPLGDKLAGASSSELGALSRDHLDAHGVGRALLFPELGMLVPAIPQPRLAGEVARVANEWLADRWLDGTEGRVYGAIVAPSQIPHLAADEIRRAAQNPRMVAVVMSANPFGKPLGHPVYGPIYEAAAELGLVVIVHAGAEGAPETSPTLTAAGPPATYTDFYALLAQSQMSHATSLITQGNFERYPGLRVLLVGAGVGWVAPYLWRFDTEFRAMRIEAPWLERLPSELFREHFRVAAYPLDPAPSRERRIKYYGALRRIEDVLCYASGYPSWDALSPATLRSALPPEWHERVMHTNADRFFDWERDSTLAATAATTMAAEE